MAAVELTMLPPNRADILRNASCVYCCRDLETTGFTKEHVIGRRFVPKGSLDGAWNLIVRACPECNGRKSDLEDDISAVTLASISTGGPALEEPLLAAEAQRKARGSISRRTGRAVADSEEPITIRTPLGSNALLTAKGACPPQIDYSRVFDLARLQLQAFFYRITYDSLTKTGRVWPGVFVPVMLAQRSNWGDRLLVEFARATRDWPYRYLGVTAKAHFKISIRQHPDEGAACWAWAVEWNQSYRVAGFFGMIEPAMADSWSFEERLKRMVARDPEGFIALGLERRVRPSEDTLFEFRSSVPDH